MGVGRPGALVERAGWSLVSWTSGGLLAALVAVDARQFDFESVRQKAQATAGPPLLGVTVEADVADLSP